MKEIFLLAVVIAASTIVAGEDKPIRPIPTKCPRLNSKEYTVHIAHEWDCTKFYKCDWGKKVLQNCPLMDHEGNRLHFNRLLQVCDWPKNAKCINYDSTTGPPTTTTTKPTTTTTKPTTTTTKPTTTTTKPTTTTSKPTTTTTKPTTTTTKPTTTTSKPTTTTIKPTTTTTKPTTTTTKPTTTTTKSIITECPKGPGAAGFKIPDKTNCRLYYVCDENGEKHQESCLEDLVFDPKSRMCDTDDGTICKKPKPIHKCPDKDDPKHPIIYPHECQCDRYFVCKDHGLLEMFCDPGTNFDVDLKKCIKGGKCPKFYNAKPNSSENGAFSNVGSTSTTERPGSNFFVRLFHWGK